jgi:hypothetical protein
MAESARMNIPYFHFAFCCREFAVSSTPDISTKDSSGSLSCILIPKYDFIGQLPRLHTIDTVHKTTVREGGEGEDRGKREGGEEEEV